MSDEQDLNVKEQTSQEGEPETQSVDKSEAERAGSKPKPTSATGNWQDDPKYREHQAERDAREARLKSRLEAVEQEKADYLKRLESLEDQAYGKDDYGKMQLAATRAAREAAAAKRELEQYRAREAESQAKMAALQEIADEWKVPVTALQSAKDYKDAIKIAVKEQRKMEEAKQAAREQDKEDNSPDLGGGRRASAPMTKLERDYDDAVKRKDSVAQMRILRQMRSTKT